METVQHFVLRSHRDELEKNLPFSLSVAEGEDCTYLFTQPRETFHRITTTSGDEILHDKLTQCSAQLWSLWEMIRSFLSIHQLPVKRKHSYGMILPPPFVKAYGEMSAFWHIYVWLQVICQSDDLHRLLDPLGFYLG